MDNSEEKLTEDEFELIEELDQMSGVKDPMAVKEIHNAAIRPQTESCTLRTWRIP